MRKVVFAIFAHPDDEAFGPSGTLLMEAQAGSNVQLISLTAGENGMNPDNLPDLKQVRLKEWREAGKLIGASKMHYFGYQDGKLDNLTMIEVADKIIELVTKEAESNEPEEIEFITNDLNGITGHIDHIVAARAACLAFYRLKETGLPMSRVRLTCLHRSDLPSHNTDWLYMEPGREDTEIDEVIDASEHLETIYKIMRAHHTQRGDGEKHINSRGDKLGVNHFITLE